MDTKDLTAVSLKVTGLVILAYSVFQLPRYFIPTAGSISSSFTGSLLEAAAALALPAIVGLLLWLFPATVTNKIVSGHKLSEATFGVPQLERVALSVLGIWLVASGLGDIIYNLSAVFFIQREYPTEQLPPRVYVGAIASAAKVVIGVAIALGAKGIQNVL